MYDRALGRPAESDGVLYWMEEIRSKRRDPIDAAREFILSEEFENKKLNNSAYVEVLYETYFGRASEENGKAYWLGELCGGKTREFVLECFAYSPEFIKIVAGFGL